MGTAFLGPSFLRGRFRLWAQSSTEYSAKAIRLLQETPVVDLLNQFRFRDFSEKPAPKITRWLRDAGAFTQDDSKPYRESGITVFSFGYNPGTFEGGLATFATWNSFIASYPDLLRRINDVGDINRAHREGKIGLMLTTQNSDHFASINDVDTFFSLGQRISQLTYDTSNGFGSGYREQRDGGLTLRGLSLLKRMEQVGMAADVSHCGDQTTLDAIEAATKPLLITHAGCRALIPGSLRCKTDEAIRKLATNQGLMGISFIRFMVRDREPVGIEHVIDQIDYLRKLVGIEHVAIGSDVDLFGDAADQITPEQNSNPPAERPNGDRLKQHMDPNGRAHIQGLDHPKRMFDFVDGLISRGYTDVEIKLILSGNAIRVLGKIWPAAL